MNFIIIHLKVTSFCSEKKEKNGDWERAREKIKQIKWERRNHTIIGNNDGCEWKDEEKFAQI